MSHNSSPVFMATDRHPTSLPSRWLHWPWGRFLARRKGTRRIKSSADLGAADGRRRAVVVLDFRIRQAPARFGAGRALYAFSSRTGSCRCGLDAHGVPASLKRIAGRILEVALVGIGHAIERIAVDDDARGLSRPGARRRAWAHQTVFRPAPDARPRRSWRASPWVDSRAIAAA